MGRNPSFLVVIFLLFCCLLAQINGRRQGDVLGDLYKAKFNKNFGTNTNGFGVVDMTNFEERAHEMQLRKYSQHGLKEKDRIIKLPGQPLGSNLSHYGGYVTVNEKAGRALYYYFVEAQRSKESLPLLLWLNGGPGCSSLAYGAMEELGPFRVHSDGKTLYKNRYSWHKAANVLFLESPAGVGFSYSNTTSDYDNCGDKQTADDNYVFLVNWLERFPEYKDRDFYISGESYAGHYVPQLAHTILRHNKKADSTIINLKGIIIGNAVINDETDNLGMYDFFASHALISPDAGREVRKYCNFKSDNNPSKECNDATDKADEDVSDIDIYNIYGPLCFTSNLTAKPKRASLVNFDPCSDYYVYAYLNSPDVQEALHANVTKITHDWEPCSDVIQRWNDSPSTIIPLLHEFLANGLRVWIYSGDNDGRIPVTSTQYSISKMDLKVQTEWYPWANKKEVAGYTQVYKGGLTFATVRGAGHEVPSFQPARALALISHFLRGSLLPHVSTSDSS